MAEDAKKSADESAEQKGRAEKEEQTESLNKGEDVAVDTPTGESHSEEKPADKGEASNEASKQENAEKDGDKITATLTVEEDDDKLEGEGKANDEDQSKAGIEISIELPDQDESNQKKASDTNFQESVREQIENCKFEIISSLQDSIHGELKDYTIKQIRKVERRRRTGVIVRDIIILVLAAIVGYFSYCLYDAKYFDFMKSECERQGNCESVNEGSNNSQVQAPEVVKDTAWYQRNYGYLFDSLKINLNADKVSAYYLYSGDYKVSEIQPSYLLAMAYNRLNSNITYDSDKGIMIPANDLKNSFTNLFGSADHFAKQKFTYDCANFEYDKESDSFVTPSIQCNSTSNRQIVEEIDEIYEEGNAMYFLTTAAIYDKAEEGFYTFDNLFKPVAKNVEKDDLSKHKSLLNQYQYRFKKVDDKYYFSDIVKLK